MLHRFYPTVKVLLANCRGKLLQIYEYHGLVHPFASLALRSHKRDLLLGPDVNRYASSHGYWDQRPNISSGHEVAIRTLYFINAFYNKLSLPHLDNRK